MRGEDRQGEGPHVDEQRRVGVQACTGAHLRRLRDLKVAGATMWLGRASAGGGGKEGSEAMGRPRGDLVP